jgi:hypothetical protein
MHPELKSDRSHDAAPAQETSMARFDPNTFPDRFALEANARRIRRAELSRLIDAAVASVLHRRDDPAACTSVAASLGPSGHALH